MSLAHSIERALFLIFVVSLTGIEAADNRDTSLVNQLDEPVSSDSSNSLFSIPLDTKYYSPEEIAIKLTEVPRVLEEPCSEEGLQFFKDIKDQIELFKEQDDDIENEALRYRSKCSFTFIANLFPIWSNQEINAVLKEWTDIGMSRLVNYKTKKLKHRFLDISFVHELQSFLDPNTDDDLKKELLFEGDQDAGSSSSRGPQKMVEAKEALATGLDGYCWPMQSKTFVRINELMEWYLTVYYQKDSKFMHLIFTSSFLNRSFYLYSICKNIQKSVPTQEPRASLPDSLKAIAELPLNEISLEESDFVYGYLSSLRKTLNDVSSRTLISFSATEETIDYSDNTQIRNYLVHETDLAKRLLIERCQERARPRIRYTKWLKRDDCAVSALVNSVYKVARNTDIIDSLKAGYVGPVISALSDKKIQEQIVEALGGTKNPKVLAGLANRSFDTSREDSVEKICIDFKMVYDNTYVDSLNYLIHHYPEHSLIASMLNDENSEVLKFYLTSLVCQKLSGR